MERIIGIDLGTSNSCVAVVEGGGAIVIPDQEGRRTQPSIVSFFPDGRQVVGHEAKEQMVYNPENTVYSSKRLIGRTCNSKEVQTFRDLVPFHIVEGPNESVLVEVFDHQYTMSDIASLILMRMKQIAEAYLGESVQKAVITVPANFNDAQRHATKLAGEMAGLEVMKIINEPTAAALAYGFTESHNQRMVVYDFGGGTFDVSVLEIKDDVYEVISTAGDMFLGGDDIDNLIVKMIVNSYKKNYGVDISKDMVALLRVRAEAEKAKRILSAEDKTTIQILSLTSTDKGMIDLNVALTRDNFDAIIRDTIANSFNICTEALKLARLEAAEIENVLLVGGSTHIPLVRQMVEDYFGKRPFWGVNADEVVSLGAAIQGHILSGAASEESGGQEAVLLDVTPLSLGLATIGGRVEKIIPRNTSIPLEQTRIFTTSVDHQEIVRIRIYQGEGEREEENQLLGVLELSDLDRSALRGDAEIEVTFEVDTNGMLQVRAYDTRTGNERRARIDLQGVSDSSGLSEDGAERTEPDEVEALVDTTSESD